jgi:probable F420-dependent oxidoreductase
VTTGARPFRFGVINERMTTAAAWLDQARRVEELGYDTFLIRDHFVPDFFGDQFAPFPALMAAAAATERLRIGTYVIDNDYRPPAFLANEVATLDAMSGGRFELGIGAGWLRREYDLAGIPYGEASVRIDRLEEGLAILKGMWRDVPVHHTGTHYRIDGLEGFPKPAQRPRPPIMIGGGRPRMLRLAGREADIVGVMTIGVGTGVVVDDPRARMSAAVAEQISWVRDGAGDRFDAIELCTGIDVTITDDRRGQTEALIQRRGWSGFTVEDVWDMPAIHIGSVDQVVEDIERSRAEFGFSYFVVSDGLQEALVPIVARLLGR